jgi:hypothetical protein
MRSLYTVDEVLDLLSESVSASGAGAPRCLLVLHGFTALPESTVDGGYLSHRYGGFGLAAEFMADDYDQRVVSSVCRFQLICPLVFIIVSPSGALCGVPFSWAVRICSLSASSCEQRARTSS